MAERWDPLRDLVTLQERMNRLFEEAAHRQTGSRGAGEEGAEVERGDWLPAADVYESEQEFTIALDLPGVARESLDIGLHEERLTIRGERAAEHAGARQRRGERPHGRFIRSFSLPGVVDREAITADYKDGVLQLHLPKRREQPPRRVEIRVK